MITMYTQTKTAKQIIKKSYIIEISCCALNLDLTNKLRYFKCDEETKENIQLLNFGNSMSPAD